MQGVKKQRGGVGLQFHAYATAHIKDRNTKVCMWGEVPNIITPIKFNVDRFTGFRSLVV